MTCAQGAVTWRVAVGFLACVLRTTWGQSTILPAAMDCALAAHTIQVREAASEVFYCPEYFSNRTCCSEAELMFVWEKVEDMLRFIQRVLSDASEEVFEPASLEEGPCKEYHSRLFSSRVSAYQRARHTAEQGARILQDAGLHFLCGACFACAVPLKTSQIDDFVRRALHSVQDTMGAILEAQRTADRAPHAMCALGYVESLHAGVPFPAWGRFAPEMDLLGERSRRRNAWRSQRALGAVLSAWLDRVLALLLELPSALLFQQSLLRLAFFYLERPDSDAHALLHGSVLEGASVAKWPDGMEWGEAAGARGGGPGGPGGPGEPGLDDLCPEGPRRLLLFVPQGLGAEDLRRWREALVVEKEGEEGAWSLLWVASAPGHVEALLSAAVAGGHHGVAEGLHGVAAPAVARRRLVWRRFEVRDGDAFVASICGGRAAWLLVLSELGGRLSPQSPEVPPEAVASLLRRIVEAEEAFPPEESHDRAEGEEVQQKAPVALRGELLDLGPNDDVVGRAMGSVAEDGLNLWGLRPAVPLSRPLPWPSEAFEEYVRAHAAFRESLRLGGEASSSPSGSRVLIYTCTSMSLCGGHGDRLNGMLGAAVVALLSGRFFFIDSQRPVPLSLVLEPQRLDWRLHGTMAALPAAINLNDKLATFEADPGWLLDHRASVLRLVSNQRLTSAALRAAPRRAEAMGLAPQPKLHAHLFHELFRPSTAFRRRLGARGLPATARLIGVHFRAGDQMPAHWRDPPRHALEEIHEFLDCAEELESSLGWNDARVILFADTDLVLGVPRVQALVESGKLLWPARTDSLIHLDRSPATLAVRGLLAVWADWWTLAFDVHALVLCHSGFGATALEVGPPRPAVLGKGCVPAAAAPAELFEKGPSPGSRGGAERPPSLCRKAFGL
eukprot:CAMPEP_0176003360 /NCGR_PEP_ID=MMETSP0120_2-20121206/1133_1 /TAXON_ID=160619 /ORGANISM="Kryptoperidinium foliaceum, Strain CCMP 1326" /LENGTH=898 /DNA_ID=CAMNT_0017335999 /DNA_START=42 /DNA_END=2739 /DNA_ORIENTATION=-